jgi:hypothetical protein
MDNIKSAVYGADDTYISVLPILLEFLSGGLGMLVSNDTFGIDPKPNVSKKLIILYKNGRIDTFDEYSTIKLNIPPLVKNTLKSKIYIGYVGHLQGGFGDFMRSAFSLYAYCIKNNIDYDIYIPSNPIQLGIKCIDKKINVPEVMLTVHHTNRDKIVSKLDKLRTYNVPFVVYSNVLFTTVNDLMIYRENFAKNIVKTEIVEKRITEIKNTYIKNDQYVCLHIRCGDKHISTGGHCKGHTTRNFNDDSIFNKIEECINFLESFKLPICLITDSDKFRNTLSSKYSLITFNTIINHVALPSNTTDNGVIDTISEFFILSESKTNIMFSHSGFVLWSSLLYNVPLYEYTSDELVPYDNLKIETLS